MPNKNYPDNARFYNIDGERYPSVTTILGVIDKPAIKRWALNEMGNRVGANLTKVKDGNMVLDQKIIDWIVQDGKKIHEKISKEAMDIGSRVHELIQEYFMTGYFSNGLIQKEPEEVQSCLLAFWDWLKDTGFEMVETEQMVFSRKYKFAGTLDAVGKMGTKSTLIDFKSSKGIWDEYYLQVAAYSMAYQEMTENKIDESYVVRFGKLDGAFEVKEIGDINQHFEAFLAAKKLWEWQRNV